MLETGKQCTHKSGQSPLPSSSFEREPNRSLNFRSLGTVLSIIKPNTYTKILEMQAIRFVPNMFILLKKNNYKKIILTVIYLFYLSGRKEIVFAEGNSSAKRWMFTP